MDHFWPLKIVDASRKLLKVLDPDHVPRAAADLTPTQEGPCHTSAHEKVTLTGRVALFPQCKGVTTVLDETCALWNAGRQARRARVRKRFLLSPRAFQGPKRDKSGLHSHIQVHG